MPWGPEDAPPTTPEQKAEALDWAETVLAAQWPGDAAIVDALHLHRAAWPTWDPGSGCAGSAVGRPLRRCDHKSGVGR